MANTASAALSSATETEEKSSSAVMLLLKLRTLIALIIVTAYFCIMAPNFISLGNLVIISKHVALTAFLAIGMTYVIVTGGIDLSVGSVVALVGAVAATLVIKNGMPWWVGVLAGIATGLVIGAWHGFWLSKMGIPGFITTLAGMMIFRGLTIWVSKSISVPAPTEFGFFGVDV